MATVYYHFLHSSVLKLQQSIVTDIDQAQNKQNNYPHLCKAHGRCVRTSRSKLSSEHIKDLFWGSEELKLCLSMHSPCHCQTKASHPFKMQKGGGETNTELYLWWPNITVNRIHSPQPNVCKVPMFVLTFWHKVTLKENLNRKRTPFTCNFTFSFIQIYSILSLSYVDNVMF